MVTLEEAEEDLAQRAELMRDTISLLQTQCKGALAAAEAFAARVVVESPDQKAAIDELLESLRNSAAIFCGYVQ